MISAIDSAYTGWILAIIGMVIVMNFYAVDTVKPSDLLDWADQAYIDNSAQNFLYCFSLIFGGFLGFIVPKFVKIKYRFLWFELSWLGFILSASSSEYSAFSTSKANHIGLS